MESDLRKEVEKYGTVVEVYVSWKRNIKDQRFGFVRFIKVGDTGIFERKLNKMWIGNFKIRVNIAKFHRDRPIIVNTTKKSDGEIFSFLMKVDEFRYKGVSFADVVKDQDP